MTELHLDFTPPLASLGNAFQKVEVASLVSKAINEAAARTERFGKQLSPVDTGRLRASIGFTLATVQTLKSVIETHTEYAVFVHEGTRYMRGRPFMETGAGFAVGDLPTDASGRIEQEFIKVFKSLH
jgi:hypothetical protein